jgi:hypothetical protein
MVSIGNNVFEAKKLLHQSNYNVWKLKMKNVLLKEDLIGHIEVIDLKLVVGQEATSTKPKQHIYLYNILG